MTEYVYDYDLPDKYVPQKCGIVRVCDARDKAVCVIWSEDEAQEKIWIPRSCIRKESPVGKTAKMGDRGELILPRWLASKKGFWR